MKKELVFTLFSIFFLWLFTLPVFSFFHTLSSSSSSSSTTTTTSSTLLTVRTTPSRSKRLVPLRIERHSVSLTQAAAAGTSSSSCFQFGVIADIQHANANDAMNFQGTKLRRYRSSLDIYKQAVTTWERNYQVDFSLILGDTIDGRAASMNNHFECLSSVLKIASYQKSPTFFCFGNHCHYCFDRTELKALISNSFEKLSRGHGSDQEDLDVNKKKKKESSSLKDSLGRMISCGECLGLNYSWSPRPGWRFISIDSYDVSLIGSTSIGHREQAETLLSEHNPNDLSVSGGWFQGLSDDKMRYVPYNGAVSQNQLDWLEMLLASSYINDEKVVIFCHQPVYSPDRPKSLVWNSEEVLDVIHRFDDTVVMWIAGHDHDGQAAIDSRGIYHIIPPAPIECEPGDTAFGVVEVHADHLRWNWHGSLPQKTWHAWPTTIPIHRRKSHI
eukprot:gene7316-8095_t